MKPSEIQVGKTYEGKSGIRRKVVSMESEWRGWLRYEEVTMGNAVRNRSQYIERFAKWAGREVEE